jgi:hypothetical protein
MFVCVFVFLEGFVMKRFVLSVLSLVGLCSPVLAQDPFPVRTVLAGETAVVPKGEYILSKQVAVRSGGKLILESGVKIRVQIGLPIQVYGEIDIRGTATDPVVIVPDSVGACGTVAVYPTVGAARPKFIATYLDLTHTKDSTSLFLSGCDFAISNSRITNLSNAANRICLSVANGASGSISGCYLDGCKDRLTTPAVGISIDATASSVDLLETIIANSDLVRSLKQFTLLSGSIE